MYRNLEVDENNPSLGSRQFDESIIIKNGHVEVHLVFFSSHGTNEVVRFAVQRIQFPITLHKAGFLMNQCLKHSFSKHCPVTCLGGFVTKPGTGLKVNTTMRALAHKPEGKIKPLEWA